MGIKPIAKLYKISVRNHCVSCRVWNGGASWPTRYSGTYINPEYRDKLITRFTEAVESRGYTRAKDGFRVN